MAYGSFVILALFCVFVWLPASVNAQCAAAGLRSVRCNGPGAHPDLCCDNDNMFCTSGNSRCRCNTGLQYNSLQSLCLDKNECADFTHDCDPEAACSNTVGSFTCACNAGYTGDGLVCEDIDECAESLHDCSPHATCTNTFWFKDATQGYSCTCNAGYSGTGSTCTELDECADALHNCDGNAGCTDTTGSFLCACNAGWTGSGIAAAGNGCSDIDEVFFATKDKKFNASFFLLFTSFFL
jgi:hypothetical protein